MTVLNFSPKIARAHVAEPDDFARDCINLFTGQAHGHMEKWLYEPSLFPGDPAGGGDYWADLVQNPGHYYLTEGDIETIQWSVKQQSLIDLLHDIETVVELGPGSEKSIAQKTIPFLQIIPNLRKYIAIDAASLQAAGAAAHIQATMSISTGMRSQDYINTAITPFEKRTAMVMWGSSLGNIAGPANTNPQPQMTETLRNFKTGLKSGDLLIFGMDSETDEQKILRAYQEPSQRAGILSALYALKRDGRVTGNFDPQIWSYEPVWLTQFGQCMHTVYPLFNQEFTIAGHAIKIPAWRRLILNNSFKPSHQLVSSAIIGAGMIPGACLSNSAIRLYICSVQ